MAQIQMRNLRGQVQPRFVALDPGHERRIGHPDGPGPDGEGFEFGEGRGEERAARGFHGWFFWAVAGIRWFAEWLVECFHTVADHFRGFRIGAAERGIRMAERVHQAVEVTRAVREGTAEQVRLTCRGLEEALNGKPIDEFFETFEEVNRPGQLVREWVFLDVGGDGGITLEQVRLQRNQRARDAKHCRAWYEPGKEHASRPRMVEAVSKVYQKDVDFVFEKQKRDEHGVVIRDADGNPIFEKTTWGKERLDNNPHAFEAELRKTAGHDASVGILNFLEQRLLQWGHNSYRADQVRIYEPFVGGDRHAGHFVRGGVNMVTSVTSHEEMTAKDFTRAHAHEYSTQPTNQQLNILRVTNVYHAKVRNGDGWESVPLTPESLVQMMDDHHCSIMFLSNMFYPEHVSGPSKAHGWYLRKRDAGGDMTADKIYVSPDNVNSGYSHNSCDWLLAGSAEARALLKEAGLTISVIGNANAREYGSYVLQVVRARGARQEEIPAPKGVVRDVRVYSDFVAEKVERPTFNMFAAQKEKGISLHLAALQEFGHVRTIAAVAEDELFRGAVLSRHQITRQCNKLGDFDAWRGADVRGLEMREIVEDILSATLKHCELRARFDAGSRRGETPAKPSFIQRKLLDAIDDKEMSKSAAETQRKTDIVLFKYSLALMTMLMMGLLAYSVGFSKNLFTLMTRPAIEELVLSVVIYFWNPKLGFFGIVAASGIFGALHFTIDDPVFGLFKSLVLSIFFTIAGFVFHTKVLGESGGTEGHSVRHHLLFGAYRLAAHVFWNFVCVVLDVPLLGSLSDLNIVYPMGLVGMEAIVRNYKQLQSFRYKADSENIKVAGVNKEVWLKPNVFKQVLIDGQAISYNLLTWLALGPRTTREIPYSYNFLRIPGCLMRTSLAGGLGLLIAAQRLLEVPRDPLEGAFAGHWSDSLTTMDLDVEYREGNAAYELWKANIKPANKKKYLEAASLMAQGVEGQESVRLMSKRDEMLWAKEDGEDVWTKCRPIQLLTPYMQCLAGPWAAAISLELKSRWTYCMSEQADVLRFKGRSIPVFLCYCPSQVEEIEGFVAECTEREGFFFMGQGDDSLWALSWDGNFCVWENDFSKYDMTQGPAAREAMRDFLMRCGMEKTAVDKSMAAGSKNVSFMVGGGSHSRGSQVKLVRDSDGYMQVTGSPFTTIQNTLLSFRGTVGVLQTIITENGMVSPIELMEHDLRDMEDVFLRCTGFRAKLQRFDSFEKATYLKGGFVLDVFGGYKWTPLLGRLVKMFMCRDDPRTYYEHLQFDNIAQAYAHHVYVLKLTHQQFVLHPLFEALFAGARCAGTVRKQDLERGPYVKLDGPKEPVSTDYVEWRTLNERYGMGYEDVRTMELELLQAKTGSVLWHHSWLTVVKTDYA